MSENEPNDAHVSVCLFVRSNIKCISQSIECLRTPAPAPRLRAVVGTRVSLRRRCCPGRPRVAVALALLHPAKCRAFVVSNTHAPPARTRGTTGSFAPAPAPLLQRPLCACRRSRPPQHSLRRKVRLPLHDDDAPLHPDVPILLFPAPAAAAGAGSARCNWHLLCTFVCVASVQV